MCGWGVDGPVTCVDVPVQGTKPQRYLDEPIETMSRDELVALQLKRLRRQVARCYERSTLYRSKLARAGVHADDILSLEDVVALPIVTKEELREDQVAHPPFGSFTVAERATWREVHPSTGTTGTPVNTIWSERDVETITAFTARTMWQLGLRPGDVVQNAFSYGLWVAGMSTHYAARKIGCLVIPTGTALSSRKQIELLVTARATALLATPSYALYLAEQLQEAGVAPESLALERGCFGGEAGVENPATRAKIEQGLGIQAFDYYGLAEIAPTFASECEEKAGLHFAEDHVLVECVDAGTMRPVADGELGILIFTHLTREATPMLRYWSNDYARLSRQRCACGRTHVRAVGGVLGRHDEMIVFKGAKFYPSQVEKVVRGFPGLSDEFRIEVAVGDVGQLVVGCTVVVEHLEGYPAEPERVPSASLEERLREALRAELGVTPSVRVEPFGTLERTTFKAQRIVRV
jgi:phenylacetate-CoA ligase